MFENCLHVYLGYRVTSSREIYEKWGLSQTDDIHLRRMQLAMPTAANSFKPPSNVQPPPTGAVPRSPSNRRPMIQL